MDNNSMLAEQETGLAALLEEETFVDCPRCSRKHVVADHRDKHICVDCAKVENSRVTYYRQHQGDWVAEAKESGIELYQQQPEETQWEFTVWTAYRDSYPGKRPSYSAVAKQLNTTASAVSKIAARWSFQVRMQSWMKYADEITLNQRRTEILDMNKTHIDMAVDLNKKLQTAIAGIVPAALKPGEIATLLRVTTEMERKAHMDTLAQEEIQRAASYDSDNPELKKAPTKQQDLGDVLTILMKAGALGDLSQLGVRQTTTTTELVAKDSTGTEASINV